MLRFSRRREETDMPEPKPDEEQWEIFYSACKTGDTDMVRRFVNTFFLFDMREEEVEKLKQGVQYAIEQNNVDIVDILINDMMGRRYITPLEHVMIAFKNRSYELIKLLVNHIEEEGRIKILSGSLEVLAEYIYDRDPSEKNYEFLKWIKGKIVTQSVSDRYLGGIASASLIVDWDDFMIYIFEKLQENEDLSSLYWFFATVCRYESIEDGVKLFNNLDSDLKDRFIIFMLAHHYDRYIGDLLIEVTSPEKTRSLLLYFLSGYIYYNFNKEAKDQFLIAAKKYKDYIDEDTINDIIFSILQYVRYEEDFKDAVKLLQDAEIINSGIEDFSNFRILALFTSLINRGIFPEKISELGGLLYYLHEHGLTEAANQVATYIESKDKICEVATYIMSIIDPEFILVLLDDYWPGMEIDCDGGRLIEIAYESGEMWLVEQLFDRLDPAEAENLRYVFFGEIEDVE